MNTSLIKKKAKKRVVNRKEVNKVRYTVLFEWDEEASVWIATSENITGLVLESDNFDDLVKKVQVAIPELLSLNGQPQASYVTCKVKNRKLVYA